MTQLGSYLLASVYPGFSPMVSAVALASDVNGSGDSLAIFVLLVWLFLLLLMVMGLWKIYKKANKQGWAVIIPIYNFVVLLEIVGKPIWWVILFFIPFVNIIVTLIVMIELSKSFGKGTGFALGLLILPFIFYPILGFGSASYSLKSQTQTLLDFVEGSLKNGSSENEIRKTLISGGGWANSDLDNAFRTTYLKYPSLKNIVI